MDVRHLIMQGIMYLQNHKGHDAWVPHGPEGCAVVSLIKGHDD